MSCLATLVTNAEQRMVESFSVVLETIESAMFSGKSEVIFNTTDRHELVSDTHIHMITANALITKGFMVARGSGTYIVSGWDNVKLKA